MFIWLVRSHPFCNIKTNLSISQGIYRGIENYIPLKQEPVRRMQINGTENLWLWGGGGKQKWLVLKT